MSDADYVLFQSPFPWIYGVRRTWGLTVKALLSYAAIFALTIVIGIIIVINSPHMHGHMPEVPELRLSSLTVLGLVLAIVFLKRRLHKQPPINFFRAIGFNSRRLVKQARIFYWASWLGLVILVISGSRFMIMTGAHRESFYELFFGKMLATVVMAPLLEEVLFRGLILNCFRQALLNESVANWRSEASALLISSFFFALAHFDPAGFINQFTMGLFLGVMYRSTGCLPFACLFHSLANFASLSAHFTP